VIVLASAAIVPALIGSIDFSTVPSVFTIARPTVGFQSVHPLAIEAYI
jgi:hypothetical protein